MHTEEIITTLLAGGIVILRTDTVYGILARAADRQAVERIYRLKDRQAHKPFIQLVNNPTQVAGDQALFARIAERYADRPTSIIIETPQAPAYLTRQGTSLGYRLEKEGLLFDIIRHTGPLVAPSANPEGAAPARTITQAKAYFDNAIDLYVDGGEVPADVEPSRLLKIGTDGALTQLR
jgi:L-threonylcarbamoyladenylate synthase